MIATLFSFFMVLLMGEKSRSRAAINRTLQVTTTKNVGLIVPHVFVHS